MGGWPEMTPEMTPEIQVEPTVLMAPNWCLCTNPLRKLRRAVGGTSNATGAGIVVAVLDTGIMRGHTAFAGVQLERRNFTSETDDDSDGHGTHCAGTIFGRRVDGTRIGVAPGVTKALIGKVLGAGGGSSDQIVEAMLWAAKAGADVISMSLGIDFPGYARRLRASGLPEELAVSIALEGYRTNVTLFERLVALLNARQRPTIVIAAAGNESRREMDARFEIAVSPPATSSGIISVAALARRTDGTLGVAAFSNTGASVSGPGVGIVSAGLDRPGDAKWPSARRLAPCNARAGEGPRDGLQIHPPQDPTCALVSELKASLEAVLAGRVRPEDAVVVVKATPLEKPPNKGEPSTAADCSAGICHRALRPFVVEATLRGVQIQSTVVMLPNGGAPVALPLGRAPFVKTEYTVELADGQLQSVHTKRPSSALALVSSGRWIPTRRCSRRRRR